MTNRKQISAVYLGGLVQGIALVAFPAASSIFTGAHGFQLSNAAYGSLFIPQAILSVATSLWSSRLARKGNIKGIFLWGLVANFLAMSLFAFSYLAMDNSKIAYAVLLSATGFLGIGFGLTVPSLNTFAALLFPKRVDAAILYLNALLGLGTALAPVFIAIFIGLGIWWGLPLSLAAAILLLLLFSFPLSMPAAKVKEDHGKKKIFPVRFWVFAAFALLYGAIETINGNWATVYMQKTLHASITLSSLALTLFWAMVTAGRAFFAVMERYLPERTVFRILPFFAACAFLFISMISHANPFLGILAFALAGLSCSALLPLVISFGTQELTSIKTSVAGGLIASYLVGYGIAAFGAGSLLDLAGIKLNVIYGFCVGLALVLGILSLIIMGKYDIKRKSSHRHGGQ